MAKQPPPMFGNLFESTREPEPYDIAAIGTQLAQATGRKQGIERAAVGKVEEQLAGPAAVADSIAEAILTPVMDGLATPAHVAQLVTRQANQAIIDQLSGPRATAQMYGFKPAGPLGAGAGTVREGQRRARAPKAGAAPAPPDESGSLAGPPEAAPELASGAAIPPDVFDGAAAAAFSPQPTAPQNLMVLADCRVGNWTILDQASPAFAQTIQYGQFVPLRKDFGPDFNAAVMWARAAHGVTPGGPVPLAGPSPTQTACVAFNGGGVGWPAGGDFGAPGLEGQTFGEPVGNWPFDANGNYTGP